jgi:hypothetical protein
MIQDQKQVPASGLILLLLVFINAIAIREEHTSSEILYWVPVFSLPLFLYMGINSLFKRTKTKERP